MTQSAITSALNGKVSDGTNNANLYGINIDKNGAYIYSDGTGNILFRYRQSKTADYSYMNLVSLISNAYSYIMHGCLKSGTDLNGVTECGGYMLAGSYSHSPASYAVLHVYGADSYRAQEITSCYGHTFHRFKDEKGNWTDWYSQCSAYKTLPSGTDLADVNTPGVYQLASNYTNAPCHYGIMFVMSGPNYTAQLIIDTDGSIHSRNGGDWKKWTKPDSYTQVSQGIIN